MWRRHSLGGSIAGEAVLVVATLVAACGNKAPRHGLPDASDLCRATDPSSADAALLDAPRDAAANDQSLSSRAGTQTPRPWPEECAAPSSPRLGKSIGHTSVVFKLELSNGQKVAWKPNARRVEGRYKGEVAAFRLAKALEIDNVLPACPHVFEQTEIAAALAPNATAAKLFADEAIVENRMVRGAAIPWVDGLQFWPLEKEPLRSEAKAWLTAMTEIPAAKVNLARQTSTLIAFDFITGNWDRYSGENVGIEKAGERVLYLDNDAAFMAAPPKDALARNKARLTATDRFSRAFIANVRTFDEARLAVALGDEGPDRPLLSASVTRMVARRMKELIDVVDTKIALRGERETLYFP